MELTTYIMKTIKTIMLFMMSKIQNLNGTHNENNIGQLNWFVVYDVKDTKFEWNSQHLWSKPMLHRVVYDVKDTKFEWNSQQLYKYRCVPFSCL